MLEFLSLGSGSSGNCYYLRYNETAILIDLGLGIRLFRRHCSNYGLTLAQIRAVLVTHDHTDHVKAVGAFSRDFHVPVYASKLVHESMLANRFVSKKVPGELRCDIDPDGTFSVGPFEVTAFYVPHDSADNRGYIIRVAEYCFVVMTDIGHFTEEMETIVGEATHLIIEANFDPAMLEAGRYPIYLRRRISGERGHISNPETADFLARCLSPEKIRRVWLCHLSEENNTPSLARRTVENRLTEVGLIGEGQPLRLEVLPRRMPTLLTEC